MAQAQPPVHRGGVRKRVRVRLDEARACQARACRRLLGGSALVLGAVVDWRPTVELAVSASLPPPAQEQQRQQQQRLRSCSGYRQPGRRVTLTCATLSDDSGALLPIICWNASDIIRAALQCIGNIIVLERVRLSLYRGTPQLTWLSTCTRCLSCKSVFDADVRRWRGGNDDGGDRDGFVGGRNCMSGNIRGGGGVSSTRTYFACDSVVWGARAFTKWARRFFAPTTPATATAGQGEERETGVRALRLFHSFEDGKRHHDGDCSRHHHRRRCDDRGDDTVATGCVNASRDYHDGEDDDDEASDGDGDDEDDRAATRLRYLECEFLLPSTALLAIQSCTDLDEHDEECARRHQSTTIMAPPPSLTPTRSPPTIPTQDVPAAASAVAWRAHVRGCPVAVDVPTAVARRIALGRAPASPSSQSPAVADTARRPTENGGGGGDEGDGDDHDTTDDGEASQWQRQERGRDGGKRALLPVLSAFLHSRDALVRVVYERVMDVHGAVVAHRCVMAEVYV